jgi:hypothetical protein
MTALKLVLRLLDWNCEDDTAGAARGNFEQINQDWSTDGVWLTQPKAEAAEAETNPNSLRQGISQGILEKVGRHARFAFLPRRDLHAGEEIRRRPSRLRLSIQIVCQIPWGREFLREF